MSKEEQGKKTSQVKSDAAKKEVIPAKSATDLSEEDLDKVAGGISAVSADTKIDASKVVFTTANWNAPQTRR